MQRLSGHLVVPLRFLSALIVAGALEPALAVPQVARGREGVVAAEHVLAAEAGARILGAGGNAVDAAVATAFAMGVLNPTSCGIGGGGFFLYFDSQSSRVHALDFREVAPKAASRDMYVRDGKVDPSLAVRGGLAIAVPGETGGLAAALDRFGRLDLARVLGPAVRYAAEGFPAGRHLATELAAHADEIRRYPELASVYLKSDGRPYREGETIVQSDLAGTLRAIARHGPSAFYEGSTARKMSAAVAANAGILTEADLRAYEPRWRTPLETTYRSYRIVGFPPPSSGGGVMLEAFNVLGGYDVRAFGTESAQGLHVLAETLKLVFADRARHYGDPEFAEVPLERLLSMDHAKRLRTKISVDRASEAGGSDASPARGGTSHLSVMDRHGNAVAITHTINTSFGSMIVAPGTGVVLNNEMDDFAAAPGVPNVYGLVGTEENSIRPGKRPLSSMSPTIVLRDGKARLAVGASGGPRIISATLQTILNVVDFDMRLDEAIRSPRIHHQWVPNVVFFEPGLESSLVARLRRMGHTVSEAPEIGAVQAVERRGETLFGYADPRKSGGAAGL